MKQQKRRQAATTRKNQPPQKRFLSVLSDHRYELVLVALLLIVAFAVRSYNLMGAGITWDERLTIMTGMKYGHNFETLDFSAKSWDFLSEHGPVSKYIYGLSLGLLFHRSLDYGSFVIGKYVSVLEGVATCGLAYLFGREFYNKRVALAAALILALLPMFVAHNQIAAIDTPVALFFTLTMLLFALALKRESKLFFVASMVSLGLLIDTKFNGLLALPILALGYLVYRWQHPEIARKLKAMFYDPRARKGLLGQVDSAVPLVPLALFGLITAVTIFAIWPWLWSNPLHLLDSLKHWTYVPKEYLLGHLFQPVPFYYYLVYFAVTTPLLLFLPLAAGVWESLRKRDAFKLFVLAWLLVPFAYGFSSFIQDNMRYLLMIYPALALLCADGLDSLARWIGSKLSGTGAGFPAEKADAACFYALTALVAVYLLLILAAFSPYYLDYYNELGGSSADVYGKHLFEFGWWGEGIYDSVTYLQHNAPSGSVVYVAAKPNQDVVYYDNGQNLTYVIPDTDVMNAPDNADYVVTNPWAERYETVNFNASAYKLVYETELHGAPLAKVYQRTG